jgi:rhodanese-related sulfurtransferase
MPNKKNLSKKTRRQDHKEIPIWVLWLAASLVLVIVAAVGIVLLRRQQQALMALPSQISTVEAWTFYQHDAVFLDVRPATKWEAYHITLSKSIPLAELPTHLNELPRHTVIVVVDDNFDLSPKGRDLLLKAGFTQVTALTGGIGDWIQAGYPFEGAYPF